MNRNDPADERAREIARSAADANMSPDEETISDASYDTSVPESPDGLAGFDSRLGGHRVLFALKPDYEMVDRGMVEPGMPDDADWETKDPLAPAPRRSPGRIHYSLNHLRPTRIVELQRKQH